MTPEIEIDELSVAAARRTEILRGVSLTVQPGRTLAVVGASGAGKTTLALSLLGHLRPGLSVTRGQATVCGVEPLVAERGRLRRFRSETIAWLGQDPAAALTPTMRVRDLVGGADPVGGLGTALEALQLPTDDTFTSRWPHQLSGGQRRRVALARALARRPRVLVLDEPAAGLDHETRDAVLGEVARLREQLGFTLVLVTHDLVSVARLATDVAVLANGGLVELGPRSEVLGSPRSPEARAMVAASVTPAQIAARDRRGPVVLGVHGLSAGHPEGSILFDHLDAEIGAGECLAVTGRSGIGKSTLARCLVGLHVPEAGTITLHGRALPVAARGRRPTDRRAIALVPQDPITSLNPAHTVHTTLSRAFARTRGGSGRRRDDRTAIAQALDEVGLDAVLAERRPRQLSGGQIQRVALARALAARPDVLVCDEVTSALDPTAQAIVLDLLARLRDERGLALVLVTHDLPAARRVATHRLHLPAERADDPALPPGRAATQEVPCPTTP